MAGVSGPGPDEPWGARLQRLREAQGMTRADLAAACIKLGRRTERREIARYEVMYFTSR